MSQLTQNILNQLSIHRKSCIFSRSFRTTAVESPKAADVTHSPNQNSLVSSQDNMMHSITLSSARIGHQKRSMFIQTMSTPNPESIKFIPGRAVLETDVSNGESGGSNTKGFYATCSDKDEIARSPLSIRLFKIDGIKSVYLGQDFVTITKFTEANWGPIRPIVFSKIMDHYQSGKPAVTIIPDIIDTTILEEDDAVVGMIKELIETRIRPVAQRDGGDIRYLDFDIITGVVSVQLAGSCVGCPSSSVTLKNGVENMLMHYIPEVSGVKSAGEEEYDCDDRLKVDLESSNGNDVDKKHKTYEERLAAAGIPFSD